MALGRRRNGDGKMKIGMVGGAGTLGSCAAFAILEKKLPGELWLFDINRTMLQAHYLDLQIAASALGEMTVHCAEGNENLAGCHVVVNATGAPWREISNRMELLNDNLRIAKIIAGAIGKFCPKAVVINATNPADAINYAYHLITGGNRKQFIGYTINDSYRMRMYAARKLGISSSRVDALVIGEHGPNQVPLWSTLKVDGKPIVTPPDLREYVLGEIPKFLRSYEALRSGRTAGWISGVGLAEMVRAVVLDTGELFPCSVILEGEYGRRGFSSGMPARVGKQGVMEVVQMQLPADEKASLEKSFDFLQETGATVRQLLADAAKAN